MTMGRPPVGPESVRELDGARGEKQRLEVILETFTGRLTIGKACAELNLGRSRFHELRVKALQGALDALAPGVPGRPPKEASTTPREAELERELKRARQALDGARVRAEVALVMPELLRSLPDLKKGASPRSRAARPRARRRGTTRA
jgi:hypothetical protein